MKRALLLLVAIAAATACQSAAYGPWPRPTPPGTQREYPCRRTATPPVLDGRLDERVWSLTPWSEPFVDAENPDGPRPRLESWVKLLWDDRHLYVAALLTDEDVQAAAERADVEAWNDGDFEVFIDAGSGGRAWFELQSNAKGVIRAFFVERTPAGLVSRAWSCPTLDGGLDVQGTLNDASDADRAWTVEMAIPWSCLVPSEGSAWKPGPESGLPPVVGDEWRINFIRRRNEPASDHAPASQAVWAWTPTWSKDPRDPQHWGRVRFTR